MNMNKLIEHYCVPDQKANAEKNNQVCLPQVLVYSFLLAHHLYAFHSPRTVILNTIPVKHPVNITYIGRINIFSFENEYDWNDYTDFFADIFL